MIWILIFPLPIKRGSPRKNNGSTKRLLRIHSALMTYGQLPESEREKDRENIRVLLQLDAEHARWR